MSSQQKRPHEAEKPDEPNKKQNKGPATSEPEISSAMEEDPPSQDRDQYPRPPRNRWLEAFDVDISDRSSSSDVSSSGAIQHPSFHRLPYEQPSNRLDRLERVQNFLRAEFPALHPIVAPSREAILAEENEQLRRDIAMLEHNLANQAKRLRTVQQSNNQLYYQLVQANVTISSLQGARVESMQPQFQTGQPPAGTIATISAIPYYGPTFGQTTITGEETEPPRMERHQWRPHGL